MANKFNKFYAQSLKLKAASADPYFKKKAILEERMSKIEEEFEEKKRQALEEKINKIKEEFENKKQQALQKIQDELTIVQNGIDAIDNIVKADTGGYGIEDLCYKEGKKWVLKYPETVIPIETLVTEEPTESGLTSVPNDGTMPAEAVEEESVNEETGEIEEHNDFQY